ncbi:MAG: hypothetical protein J5716_04825 [Alphaproteobacteria bacterium]|nr:hypothetical protein [Alphaproteobacteria bacterium]
MINRRYVRTSCFLAAALLFSVTGQTAAEADSFLNPARNSYSLSKTLDRPFLQSVPVPQVWQTDSSSEEFRRALSSADSPEELADRYLRDALWQTEATDMQNDFQTIVLDDQLSEKTEIADVLNDLMPVVVLANDDVVGQVEKIESDFDDFQISLSEKNAEKLPEHLLDLNAFFNSLKETAPMDVELASFQDFFRKKSAQETQIVTETADSFITDAVLDQAEQVFSFERSYTQGMWEADEVCWSLLINDVLDLSTGANFLVREEDLPDGETIKNSYRSASLLDREEKTDQIQGDRFSADRQALIKRLPKLLETIETQGRKTKGRNTKDVK